MKQDFIEYDVLNALPKIPQQAAACVLPALRGTCKTVPFPAARFIPHADSDHADAALWLEGGSLAELYGQIDALPAGTNLVGVTGLGLFACAPSLGEVKNLLAPFSPEMSAAIPAEATPVGRMKGRVIIVTGGAQGLGRGIADSLLQEGARVVLADMNIALARQEADAFCQTYGPGRAMACYVNVTDDASVEELCRQTVLAYGGIDVMYSNAGIVISGDLEQMTSDAVKKVADVNYIGYFRCAKYSSRYMKIQAAFDPAYTADILNTSSVAGLIGYRKNFAYCGSKFAVLGLTECFAKELLPYGIKVNSICPGNYYDGPLWNDPEQGLFVQYLKAGKIPGGKTVRDSIDYYMGREPFHRGCTTEDIAVGVLYCIEQQFETGIALPVTGGLVMGAI